MFPKDLIYMIYIHPLSKYNIFRFQTKAFDKEHVLRSNTIYPHAWNSQILSTVSNMVFKNIFSRNWKTKNKILSLIKAVQITSTSIPSYYSIFGNISTSNNARTIFFLLYWNGLIANWSMRFYTFNFSFSQQILKSRGVFHKGPQWK